MHIMNYPKKSDSKWLVALIINLCCVLSISAQFAAPPAVIINEINYRTDTPGDFTEYIELHNTTGSAINLNGWFLDDAVNFQFPNVNIPANGYVVVAQNVTDFYALFPTAPGLVIGDWSGALKNSGETITLRNASFSKIDEVDYDNWNEWPSTGHIETENLSLQRKNQNLAGKHGGSWGAETRTPGAQNNGLISSPNLRPIIKDVRRSPDSPLSTESVRVRAEFDIDNFNTLNGLQVKLEYKVLNPGDFEPKSSASYNLGWTSVNMLDNGIGVDSTANNGVFTAQIPANNHNHRDLVRYRVKVTTNNGFNVTYPDQNYDECNYAYYVYDGYPTQENVDLNTLPQIQDFTVFTTSDLTSLYIGDDEGNHVGGPSGIDQYQGDEFLGSGAVIYDGRVYDHVNFRPRGGGSRTGRTKPGIRFKMNREHSFETKNDCGQTYDIDRGRIVLSGGWVNDIGGHGLTESLIYKILTLTGSLERAVNYSQLRIVDDALETGDKGDFWGLFLILEDYNGDLIDEHSQLEEGNFWNTDRTISGRPRQLDYQGHFPNSENIDPWAENTLFNSTNGKKLMDGLLDLDMMYADRIANLIYGQRGNNYIGKHSYKEYYNSVSGKYFAWWGDMDNSFGAPQGAFEDNWVFTRDQMDPTFPLDNDIFVAGSQQIDYQNAMRCVYDLLLSDEQIDFLVDEQRALIHNYGTTDDWMEVDQKRWGHVYDATTGPSPLTADAHVEWYKQWFRDRADYMENNFNSPIANTFTTTPDHFYDPNIPNKPTITKIGNSNAIDELDFTNSTFSDPNGNSTFAARKWRIAEWSDPSNAFYDTKCKPHYEIETVWESGELSGNITTFSFDDATPELEAGRTYKVRMRHKDNSGRWSHFSNPVTFIAEESNTPTPDVIVITEIHYNPALGCAEFIEIYNNSNSNINLKDYSFADGINFTFPDVVIAAGDYKIIVEDETCFTAAFGSNSTIIGEFSGGLSNGGEEVKLQSPNGTRLDSVKWDDVLPWDTLADNGLHSLALIDIDLNNDIAVNWSTQCQVAVTPGAPNDFVGCDVIPDLSNIIINEIVYAGSNLDFIELKNCGNTPIDIQGLQIGGVGLQIADSYIIPPGGFAILTKNIVAFESNYGMLTGGPIIQYPGHLNNAGETITLTDFFGNQFDKVTYNNQLPWPIGIGSNKSIGVIDCQIDNDSPVNWAAQDVSFTPMAENTFGPNALPDYSNLVINEIHFRPSDDKHEFIELKNTGFFPIYLTDIHFEGFDFTFSDTDVIYGSGYFVIAKYNNDFTSFYGFAPDASWQNAGGGLTNTGENIRLVDLFGNEVDRVQYSSSTPWDTRTTDGQHSLALKIGATNNNAASNWSIQCDLVTPQAQNNFDSDNDSTCDDNDQCPGFDDSLIGQSCNDGDPCTYNDVYTSNCNCVGTMSPDTDNDGICDDVDQCPTLDDSVIGQSCNDLDACTFNDVWTSNCECVGTLSDADNDNICDAFDQCPNFDDNLIGLACNDNDSCTPLTVYTDCSCEAVENAALSGVASMSSTLTGSSASRLNNGIINNNNSQLAQTTGNTSNDWVQIDLGSNKYISAIAVHNRTSCCSDRINNAYVLVSNTPFPSNTNLNQSLSNANVIKQFRTETGRSVIGMVINSTARYVRIQKSGDNDGGSNAINLKEIEIFTPYTVVDADNDGVCDINDTCPNFNNNLIGSNCNDNDPCTINDKYTSNCACEGTPVGDADGDGVCDPDDQCPNFDDNLIGQPCDDGIICFVGSTWDSNCNCSGGAYADTDNDGVCDPLDECPGHDDDVDVNNNGIPDGCEGCMDYVTEASNSLISQGRAANISITTNGRVFNGNISYHAGQEVNLTSGFEVKAGAVFHGYIAPCN